ncbi:MAG: hypothetical protein Hyperionvirus15_5 [Hyperionvirus sp.]|uniref:Bacteriophage T5 Orf172 DNA-binding domain-containing protein n=1 Tax=Hyperionvirus sp. TaxID=2487770 RepID=A0A3G5A9M5_9VIRU|nr:MAG: hypothetical protein Hyperionvirus15_5 [Hyperionvirus sp.]
MEIIYNKFREYQKAASMTKDMGDQEIDQNKFPEIKFSSQELAEIKKFFDDYKKNVTLKKYITDQLKQIYYSENNTKCGHIYCLYNQIYKSYGDNVYKLGCTENLINRLSGYITYYLEESEIIYQSKSIKYFKIAEKILFQLLERYRIKNNREFFNCDIQIIKEKMDETIYLIESNDILQTFSTFNLQIPCDSVLSIFIKHLFFGTRIKLMLTEWESANISIVEKFTIDDNELFDRILDKDPKSFTDEEISKYIDLKNKCDLFGFQKRDSKTKIIEYKDILNNDEKFLDHLNLSLLILNDEYIMQKYITIKKSNLAVNNCRNFLTKIQLIKSLETVMKLQIFKINSKDDVARFEEKVQIDEITREKIIEIFRISQNKIQKLKRGTFEIWYYQLIQMIKHLCGSELFILGRNGLRTKLISKNSYKINMDILKRHMNLCNGQDNFYKKVDPYLLDICDIKIEKVQ